MSRKQENLTNSETSTSKIKKSFGSKMFIGAEIPKPFEAVSRTDGYFKLVSLPKSKFFMPKPRISYHCKDAPTALNNKFKVKPIVGFKKHCLLRPTMIAEKADGYSIKSKEQINEIAETTINLRKDGSKVDLNNFKTTSDILATAISCVMLMASKVPISDEHLTWTEHYLSHITDENGYHPPNIQGILNHIKYIRNSSPRQSEKKKSISGIKFRNSSPSENKNRKRASSIKCTSSCSTSAAFNSPIQKTK